MNNHYQRGVALITVLLIVALAAIIATEMTARLLLQMQRTTNITYNQQAYWYAMGAEAFAKRVLSSDFEEDGDITHLGQNWAQGETSYPVDYGQITGEIKDLQACLNLNALRVSVKKGSSTAKSKAPARIALEELIIALNIEDVSQFDAESMADALTDWLDEDSAIASAGGAEDNDYASLAFPYLPANNFLASVEELRVVAHFTVPVIEALKPYVCVLPNNEMHKININTLSLEQPELLQALLKSSLDEATQILSAREEEGFKELNEFFALPEMKKVKLTDEIKDQFVVDSEYFTLKTTASFNESYFALNSIMKVDDKKITVISRTIGHN
ncbi:MAG: type II secretion system minor pseudopilin GspK [Colwellia sp.]|nr:type II secretion system minor pseudopilin GspK [Colwellia sp.]